MKNCSAPLALSIALLIVGSTWAGEELDEALGNFSQSLGMLAKQEISEEKEKIEEEKKEEKKKEEGIEEKIKKEKEKKKKEEIEKEKEKEEPKKKSSLTGDAVRDLLYQVSTINRGDLQSEQKKYFEERRVEFRKILTPLLETHYQTLSQDNRFGDLGADLRELYKTFDVKSKKDRTPLPVTDTLRKRAKEILDQIKLGKAGRYKKLAEQKEPLRANTIRTVLRILLLVDPLLIGEALTVLQTLDKNDKGYDFMLEYLTYTIGWVKYYLDEICLGIISSERKVDVEKALSYFLNILGIYNNARDLLKEDEKASNFVKAVSPVITQFQEFLEKARECFVRAGFDGFDEFRVLINPEPYRYWCSTANVDDRIIKTKPKKAEEDLIPTYEKKKQLYYKCVGVDLAIIADMIQTFEERKKTNALRFLRETSTWRAIFTRLDQFLTYALKTATCSRCFVEDFQNPERSGGETIKKNIKIITQFLKDNEKNIATAGVSPEEYAAASKAAAMVQLIQTLIEAHKGKTTIGEGYKIEDDAVTENFKDPLYGNTEVKFNYNSQSDPQSLLKLRAMVCLEKGYKANQLCAQSTDIVKKGKKSCYIVEQSRGENIRNALEYAQKDKTTNTSDWKTFKTWFDVPGQSDFAFAYEK